MATHNELGQHGEQLAYAWLKEKGYEIIHCNWRHSHYEIDIIATKALPNDPFGRGKFLHFIEVKARNFSSFGYPEDSVKKKKFKNLQRAADEYLFLNPGYKWIQYDILSVTIHKNKDPEYFLIEDVFL